MATIKKRVYKEISINYKGVPVVGGTRLRVVDLVMAKDNYKCSDEELCEHFPPTTLEQVKEAFSYYEEHKKEIDRYIEEEFQFDEKMRKENQNLL